jgi:hypothetical protein
MNRFVAVVAMSCTLAGTARAAEAGAPRVFKPAASWTADYGDDYCRLVRNFSDGTDEISLAMDRVQPGQFTRIILIGNAIKLYRRATELGVRTMREGDNRTMPFLHSTTTDGKQYLLLGPALFGPQPAAGTPPGPPPAYDRAAEQEYAAGVNALLLTDGTVDPVEIDTGSLKPVIAAMQACTDDLVKSWGVDPEKQKTVSRPVAPDGNASKWLPQGTIAFSDFPKLGGGTNMIRLMVDATGKPTDCKIQLATLEPAVNEKVCKALLDNAHFQPALDASGQPFASYYVTPPFFGPPGGFGRR